MTQVQGFTGESVTDTSQNASVFGAWERFVDGAHDIRGVRPEVAISWHRSRDLYGVDPQLTQAPAAPAEVDHPFEHDAVFTELGFRAAGVVHEVAKVGGIVTIADSTGRVLAEWGDEATRSVAAAANLAPWSCWSEGATGTNGMGTALEAHMPVQIRGSEHWCRAFHDWNCAGVAVRDVVSKKPLAVLNVSCWRSALPGSVGGWLANAASQTQHTLRRRARHGGAELVAAYNHARSGTNAPMVAVDTSGKVVIADDTASVLLGVPASTPALDPAVRWVPQLPTFSHAATYATTQASNNPDWTGTTQIQTYLADEPSPIGIRPVFLHGNLVGHLISFSDSDGEQFPRGGAGVPTQEHDRRVVGVRENRMVLLRLPEVLFAESDGNDVWLSTDQGRLRAASSGLDKLDNELGAGGFLRVHRSHIVNLSRIREVERREKGELVLVMDDDQRTQVNVSRRNARAVRSALGI